MERNLYSFLDFKEQMGQKVVGQVKMEQRGHNLVVQVKWEQKGHSLN
jgi:hypothetical protein